MHDLPSLILEADYHRSLTKGQLGVVYSFQVCVWGGGHFLLQKNEAAWDRFHFRFTGEVARITLGDARVYLRHLTFLARKKSSTALAATISTGCDRSLAWIVGAA